MAGAQTKKQTSNFNYCISKSLGIYEAPLCKEGYRVSFLFCENCGVSCDTAFVIETLKYLLEDIKSSLVHTDNNQNVINVCYHLIIGGNITKTIEQIVIEHGFLEITKISSKLWQVVHFSKQSSCIDASVSEHCCGSFGTGSLRS